MTIDADRPPPAGADNREARFIISKRGKVTRKLAAGPPALTKLHQRLIEVMVYGIERPLPHFPHIAPNAALPLETAAAICRVRLKSARLLSTFPIFQAELDREIARRRAGAKSRAMQVVIDTLDAALARPPGTATAAETKVALEAADRILGDQLGAPRGSAAQVNVQINNQNTTTPGYVIRLPAKDEPTTIEGKAE